MSEVGSDLPKVSLLQKVGNLLRLGKDSPEDVKKIQEITQILTKDNQPVNKEVVTRESNLGKIFETEIGRLPNENLPPIFKEIRGAAGQLCTNEDLDEDLIKSVGASSDHPDGYVYGAGFGNIVSMTMFYPENLIPKAILAVDVLPDVVITGRIVTNLLSEAQDYSDFKTELEDAHALEKQFQKVVESETNPKIRERFEEVSPERISLEIGKVLMREDLPSKGIKQDAYGGGERISVLAVIRDKFPILKELATEGNIGVAYADLINPQTLATVKKMPGFMESNNIVYMSNVIDHLTSRGTDPTHLNDMNVLKDLGEGNNLFVHTTQNKHNYSLVADHSVPIYSQDNLI